MILAALLVLAQETAVADAAERQDWLAVRQLLEKGEDPNAAQVDGMTALHWAAHHDHFLSAKLLVEGGAKPGAKNRYGVTPLSLACVNGSGEVVTLLLGGGADANTRLEGGETVLMTAARTGKVDAVRALIDHGARINERGVEGQNALMWAAAEGNVEVVKLLLKSGADSGARLKSGLSPLLFAARNGRLEVVKVLLAAGGDPTEAITANAGGGRGVTKGMSALILAVENGHYELAIELVEAGADPNDLRTGFTPLHTLTWVRRPNGGDAPRDLPPPRGSGRLTDFQFVRELVKRGADVNLALKKGGGHPSTRGATPFFLAAKRADLPYMKLLVELGADPHRPNADGCTPLIAASGIGVKLEDVWPGTEEETLEIVKYLLERGADVNAADRSGETAMHGAAYKNFPKLVRFLHENGADIRTWNRKGRAGSTPLDIAEGFRPGNFKPSEETIAALHEVMRKAGVEPPPRRPPPAQGRGKREAWGDEKKKTEVRTIKDVAFAEVDGRPLRLDLYLPKNPKGAPLVVWVHGGAWRRGSRQNPPLAPLAEHGFAVASIDYRLSPVATFPAQAHDINAAIRFLRARAKKYGYDAKRIGIAGSSAGGHLAALVGVTNGHKDLEGNVGGHGGASSDVHAIVDYYGPTNFHTILEQSTPHGLSVRVPALKLLLGGGPEEKRELAALASPVTHVDPKDPPLLIVHGDKDPQVPIEQSRELQEAYRKHGLPVTFEVIPGGEHGGKAFFDEARLKLVRTFLERHLRR